MAKECYACKEKINIFNSQKGKSGRICKNCYKKLRKRSRIWFLYASKEQVLRDIVVWEDCQKVAKDMEKSPKKQCANCGAKISLFNRKKLGSCLYLCDQCYEQCSLLITPCLTGKTLSEVRNDIARMREYPEFTPTHTFGKITFDDKNKLWKAEQLPVFRYEEISDYEIVEEREEHTVSNTRQKTKTKGGVGSAVVGGVLFGPVGAIVGSNTGKRKSITTGTTNTSSTTYYTKLAVRIMLNSMEIPSVTVNYINGIAPVSRCGGVINEINNATGFMDIVLNEKNKKNNEQGSMVGATTFGAEEILKYKNLLDVGVITEEEFNAKKMQLLGL